MGLSDWITLLCTVVLAITAVVTARAVIEEWVQLSKQNPGVGEGEYVRVFAAVGPGETPVHVPANWRAMLVRPGCEVGFTDAAERAWIRRANGHLESIGKCAIDHYGISRPVDYQAPSRSVN